MLTLVAITLAILLIALILGFVPGSVITSAIAGGSKSRGPVALGLSIGIGFAISSIAAAWAFGLFGANSYLMILMVLTVLTFGLLAIPKVRKSLTVWKQALSHGKSPGVTRVGCQGTWSVIVPTTGSTSGCCLLQNSLLPFT